MKKVVIMTSQESFHNNYGAALQGYALYQTIRDLGFDPEIIKYRGGEFPKIGQSDAYFYTKRFFGKWYRKLRKTSEEKKIAALREKYKSEIAARERLFLDFSEENMSFWNEKAIVWRDLKKDFPVAPYYVCGSDQIWNPYFKSEENDPGYFLAFAPQGSKKIAYAPSFGCSDLPPKAQGTLKSYLSDFSAISVREHSGIDIIKKYADLDAQCVLDPTLLLSPNKWAEMARLPDGIPEKYILCYRFADSAHTRSTINRVADELGMPVISLPLSDVSLFDPDRFIFRAGPREFIGLIQNASLVCTDSFHATVFSILMKTPVSVFLRESYDGGNSMNSRVYGLLNTLSLDHLIQGETDSYKKILDVDQTDFNSAHNIINSLRDQSLTFLKNSLEIGD